MSLELPKKAKKRSDFELVCPAGTPAALKAAVDAGADAVYCGFQNATNARNFPGLNFSAEEMGESVAYAHGQDCKVLLALNTFPPAGQLDLWHDAVNTGAAIGVDAFILADIAVADYAAQNYPDIRRHLSVQAGASSPEAIRFYCQEFGISRVVLPRILTIAEIAEIKQEVACELEAFIFGNIGMMAEGRCSLSNYATGCSTNMQGVCSPAQAVHYKAEPDGSMSSCLGQTTIDRFGRGEAAGYPTICKGRYSVPAHPDPYYAFEEPVSLNLTSLLPEMIRAGVSAFKIEGRQRSRAYVRTVVQSFHAAFDAYCAGRDIPMDDLLAITEGQKETSGAFGSRKWR
jgi:putative protease